MRIGAKIIGAAVLGLTLSAHASIYSSMAVPGDHNGWDVTPSMVLVGGAGNVWVCTQTISSASGSFKFAANASWTTNWGGNASIARVPAVASAPTPGGGNLAYSGFSNGLYRFTFNDSTLEFQMEWVGAPLPLPAFTNMSLAGDFNGWTPGLTLLTNHTDNTNRWSGSVDIGGATEFQFCPNHAWDDQYGAPEATTIAVPFPNVPVTNNRACGRNNFALSSTPGTFQFTLDVRSNLVILTQTATQTYTISSMTVQGNFIDTATPPVNMMRMGDTTVWESDHHITNSGTLTLRFAANSGFPVWGATNATPIALPAAGTLATNSLAYANLSGVTPGRYRITFNHLSRDFTLRQNYPDDSLGTNVNLLKNPGFEKTTNPDGGDAVDWSSWQAWPKRVADGYLPHSGNWSGAIHGQLFPEWTDYGSFAQDVPVAAGNSYRASAWFKATPDWTAESMQLKMEWRDAAGANAGGDSIEEIEMLSTNWVKYSVEGAAPAGAVTSHVVFLCSGAGTTGTMHIDDAEMRAVAGRIQNFDTWGALTNFASFSPDWSVTSGKTTNNLPPGRPEAGVLISQYVEGTGKNKAIEIYNGTLSNLDLAAGSYVLQQYNNGSLTASVTMALSGILAEGDTLVVARPSSPTNYAPDPAISGLPGLLTNKFLTFNGDDVVVLRKGGASGTILDRVGQVGANAPSSIWSHNAKNQTLSRKQTVFFGTTNALTAPFPVDQWESSASDTFDGLGSHDISYLDPNQPYTPAGYSLILDSGATLMSGDLAGGIGDVSFWWRTESMTPPVTVSIATASSETGPWTTNTVMSSLASSNFAYYVTAINRADHLWLKIQQTDGGTNRFRIDEITVTEPTSVKRLEDFNAWTDPSYFIAGNYSRNGWSIQNASIAPTTGVLATRAALLGAPFGAVLAPVFEGGVGEVRFWAKANESSESAYLLLQTSIDGGSNWVSQRALTATTGATYSVWLYVTNANAQARLVFNTNSTSGDALVDNVEIRLPALYRNQNFDAWPTRGSYTSETIQGWTITNCMVNTENAYAGQVARLNTTIGNYVLSPELPGGIGTISFRIRKWLASDAPFTLQVQLSPNGTSWTTLTNVSAASTNYQLVSIYRSDTTNRYVRFYHSAGAVRVLLDDIRCPAPAPRPEVLVTPGLDPANPIVDEPMTLVADVVPRYGATVLSVTGSYRIAAGAWNNVPMVPIGFSSYASAFEIPGQPAGTMIRYQVKVQYAGIGAATNSTTYTTNIATTAIFTNFVATVPQGNVWINEIFYAPYGDEWAEGYNHEYVELCGVAGTDVSGWKIQLAFGSSGDIALNTNQPIYATYTIPPGTVFTNATPGLSNGFSFYVLGDQELTTNHPVNQVLTTYVPTNVQPFSIGDKDHIYDGNTGVGVIRLVNQFGNLVYSLSYNGYAPSSDRIPQSQDFTAETNSIGLAGSNYTYAGFAWDMGGLTIGTINDGQIFVDPPEDTNVYAFAWHTQGQQITPVNTNDVPPFSMFDYILDLPPPDPFLFKEMAVYYGYTNAAYPNASGILYHRQGGIDAVWSTELMNIRDGSLDAAGNAYAFGTIDAYTYRRFQTIEYFILVNPNQSGIDPVYLGSDSNDLNISTLYTDLVSVEQHPFTYMVPIADPIAVTNFAVTASNIVFWTDGNDPVEPLTIFNIRTSTNLLVPPQQWRTNTVAFTQSSNIYHQWTFTIPQPPTNRPALFYRVNPLGP